MCRKKKKQRKQGKPFSNCPVDICPKCKTKKILTKHHIFPSCFWGKYGEIALICRDCHDDLEYFIQTIEGKNKNKMRNQLPKISYLNIYKLFVSL